MTSTDYFFTLNDPLPAASVHDSTPALETSFWIEDNFENVAKADIPEGVDISTLTYTDRPATEFLSWGVTVGNIPNRETFEYVQSLIAGWAVL